MLMANGVMQYAHRLVWEYTYGPIPEGFQVLHHCDNPPCCNPEHLFLGTSLDNNRDRDAKGRNGQRNKTRCPQGHLYDKANTHIPPNGYRHCRACTRERARQYRAAQVSR
jgi:HNH endonuclease